jgi:hypothetical protein
MAWLLLAFGLTASTAVVVLLDRMRREEDREDRAHQRALLREVRRHPGDT